MDLDLDSALDALWRNITRLDREIAAVADEIDTEAADVNEAATEEKQPNV